MSNISPGTSNPIPTPTFISLLLVSFGAFLAIGPLIGIGLALPFFDFDLDGLLIAISDPLNNPQAKIPTYIVQGTASIIGFVLVPWIYLTRIQAPFFNRLVILNLPRPLAVLQIALIGIAFMVALAPVVEWNAEMTLPGFLSGFETWAKDHELLLEQLTRFLTQFDNPGQFAIAFLVIAVIPAIGEELLFRGVIQNQVYFLTGRGHLAIWITAFFFSAFHLQFYGFLPRMLLGVLFGYLYYWSGNLIIPILAHFVNNGFTLTMVYLHQLGVVEFDLESTDQVELLPVMLSILVASGLIVNFRNSFSQKTPGYE